MARPPLGLGAWPLRHEAHQLPSPHLHLGAGPLGEDPPRMEVECRPLAVSWRLRAAFGRCNGHSDPAQGCPATPPEGRGPALPSGPVLEAWPL